MCGPEEGEEACVIVWKYSLIKPVESKKSIPRAFLLMGFGLLTAKRVSRQRNEPRGRILGKERSVAAVSAQKREEKQAAAPEYG